MKQEHIFFDVETTGLDPKVDGIIDMAAVRTDGDGNVVSRWTDKIWSSIPVSEDAAKVNGFSEDKWKDAVRFDVALSGMCATILKGRTDKYVVVAHFADFDRTMLSEVCKRQNLAIPFEGRAWIDTSQLAWPLRVAGLIDSRNLESVCRYYSVTNIAPHTAAGDADAACQVYWRMMRRFSMAQSVENSVRGMGGSLLEGLLELIK